MSLFFLQTAMFAEFGDNSPWQKGMNIGAGAGVFLLVAAIAVWTLLRGARGLARLAREEEEPV